MSTTTLPQPLTPVPRKQIPPEEWPSHIILNAVPWEAYETIGELFRDQPIRMTYSEGTLEIMTLSLDHESSSGLLGRLIEALTEELDIDVAMGKSTTFKRELLDKGVELDECYWIANERAMRGKKWFDPDVDPPPDLAVEVEVSRTIIDRLVILAALKVPEVWRYDGTAVTILLLTANGTYAPSPTSQAFPYFSVAELPRFLAMRATVGETKLVRAFRDWVRQNRAAWGH